MSGPRMASAAPPVQRDQDRLGPAYSSCGPGAATPRHPVHSANTRRSKQRLHSPRAQTSTTAQQHVMRYVLNIMRTSASPAVSMSPLSLARGQLGVGASEGGVVGRPPGQGGIAGSCSSATPQPPSCGLLVVLETKVIRMFPKVSQSRRRPLLGPSPG